MFVTWEPTPNAQSIPHTLDSVQDGNVSVVAGNMFCYRYWGPRKEEVEGKYLLNDGVVGPQNAAPSVLSPEITCVSVSVSFRFVYKRASTFYEGETFC